MTSASPDSQDRPGGRRQQGDPAVDEEDHRLPKARSQVRNQQRRNRVQQAPKKVARRFITLTTRMSPASALTVTLVVVVLALFIATPLRNYYEQRTQLAEIEAEIQQQEQHKKQLQRELERYEDEDYLKEQARIRLGVIEPGESAYRIISPEIQGSVDAPGTGKSPSQQAYEDSPWFEKLWGSIAEDPEGEAEGQVGTTPGAATSGKAEAPRGEDGREEQPNQGTRLPILPEN